MSNRLIFFSCFAKYSLRSEWRESKSFFIFTLQSPLFTLLYSDFESTFQILQDLYFAAIVDFTAGW